MIDLWSGRDAFFWPIEIARAALDLLNRAGPYLQIATLQPGAISVATISHHGSGRCLLVGREIL